jgi:hypothetical protein
MTDDFTFSDLMLLLQLIPIEESMKHKNVRDLRDKINRKLIEDLKS